MPQILPTRFSPGSVIIGEPSTIAREDRHSPVVEAPNAVGRTMAELEILLAPLLRGDHARDRGLRKWPMGQTIAFVVVSCGLFWAAAALAAWSLL